MVTIKKYTLSYGNNKKNYMSYGNNKKYTVMW